MSCITRLLPNNMSIIWRDLRVRSSTGQRHLTKRDIMDCWEQFEPVDLIKPEPIPYQEAGSKICQDGIRITGTLEFIGSILSRIPDYLVHDESDETRLDVKLSEIQEMGTGELTGYFRCNLFLTERGPEVRGKLRKTKSGRA
jgi:hypothetical protein